MITGKGGLLSSLSVRMEAAGQTLVICVAEELNMLPFNV